MSNLEKLYEEMVVPQKKETTMEFKRVPKNLEEDSKLTPRKTELDEKSKETTVVKEKYKMTIRKLSLDHPEILMYDYKFRNTDNPENEKDLSDVVNEYGYYIKEKDLDIVGEYNDIKAYYDLEIYPINHRQESTIKSSIKKSTLKESEADFFDDFEQDAGMRNDVLEYMLNFFSPEDLLTELVRALGDDTALENFGYIARMNDIPKKSEYESGE
jgi:hypothetical protein